jgi:hypothetical protein
MILTKIISVIHFACSLILSVIHFAGCLFLIVYPLGISISHLVEHGYISEDEKFLDMLDYIICFALFLPSSSSTYLLAIRWMFPENNKMAHIKLINKIIYYLNFACWTGWLVFGIWGVIALESLELYDNRQFEIFNAIFSAAIISIPMSVSGVVLFLFSTEFWRKDLIKLFKSKSNHQVKASA